MTIENKAELNEWIGIELVLLVKKEIEWEHIFGHIECKTKGEEQDYWFIGNPNQNCPPIKLLTAKIKKYNPEDKSAWKQDKLSGEVEYYGKNLEYFIDKEVKN
jgi:hypothetical protein